MTRAGEGEERRFALNCGPTSERKRKTKRVPFGERRGGSSVPGFNANATRAMYSQNRLTGRHRNHYSHQNLCCSAYASRLSLLSFVFLSSYFWNNVCLSLHNSTHWVYSNLSLLPACGRLYVYKLCNRSFLVLSLFVLLLFSFAALPWLPSP